MSIMKNNAQMRKIAKIVEFEMLERPKDKGEEVDKIGKLNNLDFKP